MRIRLTPVMTLLFASSVFFALPAHADRIAKRAGNQERRIAQGVSNGSLTKHEAAQLERQQEHIGNVEAQAAADGEITKKEKLRIHEAQNRASVNIAAKKHNARHE